MQHHSHNQLELGHFVLASRPYLDDGCSMPPVWPIDAAPRDTQTRWIGSAMWCVDSAPRLLAFNGRDTSLAAVRPDCRSPVGRVLDSYVRVHRPAPAAEPLAETRIRLNGECSGLFGPATSRARIGRRSIAIADGHPASRCKVGG